MIEWPTVGSIRDDCSPIISILCGGLASQRVLTVLKSFIKGRYPDDDLGLDEDSQFTMVNIFLVMLLLTENDPVIKNYYPMLYFLHRRKLAEIDSNSEDVYGYARAILNCYFNCSFRRTIFSDVASLDRIPMKDMFTDHHWVIQSCPLYTGYRVGLTHADAWSQELRTFSSWKNGRLYVELCGLAADFGGVPLGAVETGVFLVNSAVTVAGPKARLELSFRFNIGNNMPFLQTLRNLSPWTLERRTAILQCLETRHKNFRTPVLDDFVSKDLPFDGGNFAKPNT